MNIVISIKPEFTSLILSGKKTIEMRSKIGKKFTTDANLIIYSSTPNKAIVAVAKIKGIQHVMKNDITPSHLEKVCISTHFFEDYMSSRHSCYLIELKNVQSLKTPIPLSELKVINFTAPQSFCYASYDLISLVNSYI